MDSKKKRDAKATPDIQIQAARQPQPDMSKYARAVSNKSKINYADLKLARHEVPDGEKTAEKGKKAKDKKKGKADVKSKDKKKAAPAKGEKGAEKKNAKGTKAAGSRKTEAKPSEKKPAQSAGSTAEERYSNALGSGDHYSSAIEKYYLKYPEKKRPRQSAKPERKQAPKKRKKHGSSACGAAGKQNKLSMAEIAVKNKQTTSVKQHARAARNAKARGVVSSKVANRNIVRRRKKRSGALNVLMVTLLLVFMVSVGVLVFFNIKQVRVEGDSPYSDTQIRNICSLTKGSNILFIDSDGAAERVVRELPYIEKCTVDRKLPSTVVIRVKKADVLGVAQENGGRWSVLSTEGKMMESSADKLVAVGDVSQAADAPPSDSVGEASDASAAEIIAAQRMVPLLTGLDLKHEVSDGFLTGHTLEQVRNLVMIREAFKRKEMRLTSMGVGEEGYQAVYDDRLVIIFGETVDAKTVNHRMDEVHHILFVQKKISDTDKGTFRFRKNVTYFRYKYDVSEEELEKINLDRRRRNQQKLYSMAEIFLSTGKDWFEGNLTTE